MLPNNAIDRNIQMMLLPLNVVEFIYCQPKYQIVRECVTPNGIRGIIHCFIGVFLIILINIVNLYNSDFVNGNSFRDNIFKLSLTDTVFYGVSSVLVCAVNMAQKSRNVQLILKMQKAYRALQDKDDLKGFQKYNWIFITTTFVLYFLYNLMYTILNIFKIPHLVYNMALFYFDVNVIVAVRTIMFLEYELRLWRMKLDLFARTCSKTNHKQLVKYLVHVGFEENKIFAAYVDIIEAFKLCSGIFGMSILVLVVEGFGHPLIYIQHLINVAKISQDDLDSQFVPWQIFMVSLVWIAKTFAVLSCLCAACERFYLAAADVEAACAVIQADDACLVYAHRLAKNVHRFSACAEARSALRAGSILDVGATTPLHLLMLLGTYTVVLLQFAFL